MSLKWRLVGWFFGLGLVPFLVIGGWSWYVARSSLEAAAIEELESIRQVTKTHLKDFFQDLADNVTTLGFSEDTHALTLLLEKYHDEIRVKEHGDYDVTRAAYKKILEHRSNVVLRDYVERHGFYDLFLICKRHGHVMYSVRGGAELGTNLKYGEYQGSNLARMWERVVEEKKVVFEDFQPYEPDGGKPACFIGAPIMEHPDQVSKGEEPFIGVLGLQVSTEQVNRIMRLQRAVGLKKKGSNRESRETYLVGAGNTMRSDSSLSPGTHSVEASFANPERGRVNTYQANQALQGTTGSSTIEKDYRGKRVLSAYAPVDVLGTRWALLVEVDKDDALLDIKNLTRALIPLGGLLALGVLISGLWLGGSLTGPVLEATQNLNTTSNEILAAVQEQATGTREQAASIQQTTTTMEEIGQTGAQISEKATQVAQAAERTSTTSQGGVEAVEEAHQTMQAIREQVEQVAESIVQLSEKTQVIGEIIATVNDISEQSNLLAINAAIEAVGAGEHGRRFAVVANEVKNLADQAKESTVQVRTILGEIQQGINSSVMNTEEAVKRVDSGQRKAGVAAETIRQLVRSVNESIQTFQQIVAGTNQQQIGIEQVTQALKDIRGATEQTSVGIDQVEKAVASLAALSGQLRRLVEKT